MKKVKKYLFFVIIVLVVSGCKDEKSVSVESEIGETQASEDSFIKEKILTFDQAALSVDKKTENMKTELDITIDGVYYPDNPIGVIAVESGKIVENRTSSGVPFKIDNRFNGSDKDSNYIKFHFYKDLSDSALLPVKSQGRITLECENPEQKLAGIIDSVFSFMQKNNSVHTKGSHDALIFPGFRMTADDFFIPEEDEEFWSYYEEISDYLYHDNNDDEKPEFPEHIHTFPDSCILNSVFVNEHKEPALLFEQYNMQYLYYRGKVMGPFDSVSNCSFVGSENSLFYTAWLDSADFTYKYFFLNNEAVASIESQEMNYYLEGNSYLYFGPSDSVSLILDIGGDSLILTGTEGHLLSHYYSMLFQDENGLLYFSNDINDNYEDSFISADSETEPFEMTVYNPFTHELGQKIVSPFELNLVADFSYYNSISDIFDIFDVGSGADYRIYGPVGYREQNNFLYEFDKSAFGIDISFSRKKFIVSVKGRELLQNSRVTFYHYPEQKKVIILSEGQSDAQFYEVDSRSNVFRILPEKIPGLDFSDFKDVELSQYFFPAGYRKGKLRLGVQSKFNIKKDYFTYNEAIVYDGSKASILAGSGWSLKYSTGRNYLYLKKKNASAVEIGGKVFQANNRLYSRFSGHGK